MKHDNVNNLATVLRELFRTCTFVFPDSREEMVAIENAKTALRIYDERKSYKL